MSSKQIETHLKANMNMNMSKKHIVVANFLGGLAWGLGSVVGATLIVAILIAVLRLFNFIPGLSQILESLSKSPR